MKEQQVVKRTLFSWVFSARKVYQLALLGIAIVMVFARVVPLEMQKRIVNDAITHKKTDLLVYYCLIYLASVSGSSSHGPAPPGASPGCCPCEV